jgi:hypothetical protein
VPEGELIEVERQVPLGDVMEVAHDAPLDERPVLPSLFPAKPLKHRKHGA